MTPFVMRDVSKDDLALFRQIRRTVRRLPDIDFGPGKDGRPVPVSCHMLCRALAAHFPVRSQDGYFGEGSATHSWLLTGAGLIIDPYPWAMVGGPVMVYAKGLSPWRPLYRAADLSGHLDPLKPAFDAHVAAVTEEVRRILKADEPRYDF